MGDSFFIDMQRIADFLFNLIWDVWIAINNDRLLSLAFSITLIGFAVWLFRRISNNTHQSN